MLRLYTELECSTMPGTGQKVCGGGWVGGGGGGGVETNYSVNTLSKSEQKADIIHLK